MNEGLRSDTCGKEEQKYHHPDKFQTLEIKDLLLHKRDRDCTNQDGRAPTTTGKLARPRVPGRISTMVRHTGPK
jgi:hypothetical protein